MGKFFLKSTTFWGGLIAALPGLGAAFGWEISAADIAQLKSLWADLLDAAQALVGLLMVIWGRNRAKSGGLRATP